MKNEITETNVNDVVHLAASKLALHGIVLGEQLMSDMNDVLTSFLHEKCSVAVMDDSEVDTDDGKKIIQVSFDAEKGNVLQRVWVTNENYTELDIISGLSDGTLETSMNYNDDEMSFIKVTGTGRHVATVLSQEAKSSIGNFEVH